METTEQDPDHGKECYIFWLHSHFPRNHPRKGKKTMFEQLVNRGVKIHGFISDTDDFRYDQLRQIAEELDAGSAYVSVRIKSNNRRESTMPEVKRLYRIGVQKAKVDVVHESLNICIDDNECTAPWVIASSGGLCVRDLQALLCPDGKTFSGCLVHFTDMRY